MNRDRCFAGSAAIICDSNDRANCSTARFHTKRLSELGILDHAQVFPGHRYRLSPSAEARNRDLIDRIAAAEAVFGEGIPATANESQT